MVEPRAAKPTVQFIDDYCQWYQSLFPEVRALRFKQLHLGLISEAKRKSLPAIAQGIRQCPIIAPFSDNTLAKSRYSTAALAADFGNITRTSWSLMTRATGKGITLIT